MREVVITGESITLGQLLKFSGIASSGAEAKAILAEATVLVNGVRELRRGRKLRRGDEVQVDGEIVCVA